MRVLSLLSRLLFVSMPLGAIDVPPPPEGYQWEQCPDIGGALLRPDRWHFKRYAEGDRLAYFITPEAWSPPAAFEVGLTFNVIWDVPEKKGISPSQMATNLVENALRHADVESSWAHELGPFKSHGVIYVQREEGLEDIRVHALTIGNDKTGTAYVLLFEAPVSEWDEYWNAIEPSVEKLLIDDEY